MTPRTGASIRRLTLLWAIIIGCFFGLTPAAAAPAQQASPTAITILPINNARLLAGQRFDLRIEVGNNLADNTDASTFAVTIDGRPVAQYFGKTPVKSNTTPQTAELTLRNVAFVAPGRHTVRVAAGSSAAEVSYDVIRPTPQGRKAKNVVLFVGDGMAWNQVTIARIVAKGLTQGKYNGLLNMDTLQTFGSVSTSGYDSLVTDSANSASAYATGQKGVVNAMGTYEDNTPDPLDDPRVENMIEILKRSRNMATGLVTTSEVEDATPAAFVAHTRRRAEKQYIADQFLDDPLHQPDVLMGGGSAYFIPKSTAGSKRKDERNLVEDFRKAGYAIAGNRTEMNAAGTPQKLLGLYHPDNMNVWIDREYTKDPAVLGPYTDQPSVPEMTKKALDILSAHPNGKRNGFFLMVEGASIDKQLHPMDWERATADTIEMDRAIGVVLEFMKRNPDTLLVVTADHSHSVSVFGTYDATMGPGNPEAVGVYNTAKFPTFSDANGDGFPDSWTPSRTLAIGFGNHPAYRDDFIFNPKPLSPTVRDPNIKDREVYIPNPARDPQGILYPSNLPSFEATEVHSADDVPVFASGPSATYFGGHHDNTDLFVGIVSALGIDATQNLRSVGASSGSAGLPLFPALGALFGLAAVLGAGGYLRRRQRPLPVAGLRRFRGALRAGVASFSAAMRQDRD